MLRTETNHTGQSIEAQASDADLPENREHYLLDFPSLSDDDIRTDAAIWIFCLVKTPVGQPVLELHHSTRGVIRSLIPTQVIGAGVLYTSYAIATNLYFSYQMPFIILALISGVVIYTSLTAAGVYKYFRTEYLKIYSDGTTVWTPFLSRRILKYPAGVRWEVYKDKIQFLDISDKLMPETIPLPKTIEFSNVL